MSQEEGDYEMLREIGGEAVLIGLAEEFGGMRLAIPEKMRPDHDIARAIGFKAAQALCDRAGRDVIRVPLVRELRVPYYRLQGLSNGKIARRLGITEGAVDKMFNRLARA